MTRYEFRGKLRHGAVSEANLIEENEESPPKSDTKRIFRFEGRIARVWNKEKSIWEGDNDKFNYKGYSLQELFDKLPATFKKVF